MRNNRSMWELYCNDAVIGTVDTREKAEDWLAKMEAADTDQEFTWGIVGRTDEQAKSE